MRSKKIYYTQRIADYFIKLGSTSTKVDDLALQLGVTKKTLYNYFESKQHMVECVIDYLLKQKVNEIRSLLLNASSPADALCSIGIEMLSFADKYSTILVTHEAEKLTPLLKAAFGRRKDEMEEIVEYCFTKGVTGGVFESDINIALLSRYYVFQLEQLFLSNRWYESYHRPQLPQLLYRFLSGISTPLGRSLLRESFGQKVTEC